MSKFRSGKSVLTTGLTLLTLMLSAAVHANIGLLF